MYKMGNLTNENNGTITVTDADGKTVDVAGTFEVTGVTGKGELSLDFTSKTGVTAGVLIGLTGMAGMDGSIDIDLAVSDGASFGLVASSAVVTAVDLLVKADVAALAKAVKAKKAAEREFILALQDEAVATTEAKTAVSTAATTAATLSAYLPTNQNMATASNNLMNVVASEIDDDVAIASVQEAFNKLNGLTPAEKAAAITVGGTAGITTATEATRVAVVKLNGKKLAKAKKGAKFVTVGKAKKVLINAGAKLKEWYTKK